MRKVLLLSFALILGILSRNASAALALDGSTGVLNSTGSPSATLTLTTTASPDVIVVSCAYNGASSVTSVAGSGLTFTHRAKAGGSQYIDEWYAIASSPLSSEVITVTFSGSTSYNACTAFGISGANSTAPYDTNSVLPVISTATPTTFSTSNANDIILGLTRTTSAASPTPISGWTAVYAPTGGYFIAQYEIVSTVQSSASYAGPATNGTIVDAVVQASGGGACTHNGYSSSGALAVPNGTSGSYWGKTGAFVTPTCATGGAEYWSPALGNFTIN